MQALWIFPAVVLTGESISQQGKDKPNLTIHLTLTLVESPGQHSKKGTARQNTSDVHVMSVETFSFSTWLIVQLLHRTINKICNLCWYKMSLK